MLGKPPVCGALLWPPHLGNAEVRWRSLHRCPQGSLHILLVPPHQSNPSSCKASWESAIGEMLRPPAGLSNDALQVMQVLLGGLIFSNSQASLEQLQLLQDQRTLKCVG